MGLNRCTNRTGYRDFVGVFFPHVWRRTSQQHFRTAAGLRRKTCRRLGHFETAMNCLGHDLEILLAFARTGEYKASWQSILSSLGGPIRSWVSAWPNETALVVMTTGHGRLLHPALRSKKAQRATVVTYAGSTNWLQTSNAYAFTDSLAHANADSAHATDFESRCSSAKRSVASGHAHYYYPDTWPHDVTMQYPSPFDTKKLWRGPHGRHLLASFIGTPTHCTRQDLLNLWLGKNRTGLSVMETVHEKNLYSQVLQQSRFCLVLDGHYPWTIRFLDVLQHGCVPVILSESWHPPLHRLLAWTGPKVSHFPTVVVHPRWMHKLDRILGQIKFNHWVEMQALTMTLARIFDPRYSYCPTAVLAEVLLARVERHSLQDG
ncbi:unnamed protein product [Durusdinium trenchii]